MDDRHPTATIFVDAPSLAADGAPRRCEGRCKVPGSAASKFPDPLGLLSPSSTGDWTLEKETSDRSGFQTVRTAPLSPWRCTSYSTKRQLPILDLQPRDYENFKILGSLLLLMAGMFVIDHPGHTVGTFAV
jgi:hypothetical protein